MENLRNRLGRTKWHVHIRERYSHGHGVLVYLARYLRGGPLSNRRLLACDGEPVVFQYAERAKGPGGQATPRTLCLPITQFIGRWLQHVPPPGAVRGRAGGLDGHTQGAALAQCRPQVGPGPVEVSPPREGPHEGEAWGQVPAERCPVCGQPLVGTALLPHAAIPPPAETSWERVA